MLCLELELIWLLCWNCRVLCCKSPLWVSGMWNQAPTHALLACTHKSAKQIRHCVYAASLKIRVKRWHFYSVSIYFSLGLSCFSFMLCFPRACCFALSGFLFPFCMAVYSALIYLLIHSVRHSFIFILAATSVLLPFHYLWDEGELAPASLVLT